LKKLVYCKRFLYFAFELIIMLWTIHFLSTASAEEMVGNCTNFALCGLCGANRDLMPNPGNLSCNGTVCGVDDIDTCCVDERTDGGTWNFLMIYLLLLTVAAVFFFLGYSLGSKGEESSKDAENKNAEPTSNVVSPEVEEDGEIGRVYLL